MQAKVEMGQRVIDKITRLAPNFERSIIRHTTFTPKHMGAMFGAPGGDYCHGLFHANQIGPNRPGPKGYLGQPIPIEGLYLGSAGCHGGPGITFIPGLQRRRAALADRSLNPQAEQLVQQREELVRARRCERGARPGSRHVQGDQRRLQRPAHVQRQPATQVRAAPEA